MPDEVYRPTKKAIVPDMPVAQPQAAAPPIQPSVSPPSSAAPHGAQSLNEMSAIRQAAAEELGGTNAYRDPMPMGEQPGMAIQGNIPPQFQQALQQQYRQANPEMSQPRPMPRLSNESAGVGIETNTRLQELIQKLTIKTGAHEPVQLPSMGRFYDGNDGPTDGVVHIRPMTGNEEEILAQQRLARKGIALDMIFESCLQERYKTENFLSIDRNFLMIYLRGISYGNDYDAEVTCTNCETAFLTTIDLNFDGEPCPLDFNASKLFDVLPVSGFKFKYRLSRGRDERMVEEHRGRKRRSEFSEQLDDTLLYRLSVLVEDIEGLNTQVEIQTLLKQLPGADLSYLRTCVTEPPFGYDTKVDLVCPHCMNEFTTELPIGIGFFFPRGRKKTHR